MSVAAKVLKYLENEPEMTFTIDGIISHDRTVIRFNDEFKGWQPAQDITFLAETLNDKASYRKDYKHKTITVNKDEIISSVEHEIIRSSISLLRITSPAKSPMMTNVYKDFKKSTSHFRNNSKIYNKNEFIETLLKILEYRYKIEKESGKAIQHCDNSAHRKNIYSLLIITEKKYGCSKKKH